ncbi:MAG TPA: nuclear transport factor 2 family protein [Pyrinomonadaceae bacterium]|jgi:ketosteroid isomerase-like protein|nr:nuclear transport factor 2 family protein [Pyrinomonadaceae bacterium]
MKKLFILFALLITVVSASFAQKTAPAKETAKETDEQWLTRFEIQSAEALVKGDFSAVEKYISNDSVLTDPSGMMFTKAQTADLFKTGMLKFESSKFSEIKVRVFNGTTAVVTYLSEDKGMIKYADGKTQDISGKYRWTDTFVKMNGMWMCVATHGTPGDGNVTALKW